MALGLIQIWLDLPGKDFQEMIQAAALSAARYQVREIPFASNQVNYLDIVLCKAVGETPRLVMDVVRQSGYRTLPIMFAAGLLKKQVREHIQSLRQWGVTYRRSGLRAFSLSLPPDSDHVAVVAYIAGLRQAGALVDNERDGVIAAEMAYRNLHYLLREGIQLQDGLAPDAELDELT